MAETRNWLKTLWPASYKGVPFFFESDDEKGGRGLVIHQFPHRDDPFIEDLGENPRFYDGSAYVHGDDADALAVRLSETLASRGAGTLVVPIRGPVTVHCESFERNHQRDRLGYVAFKIKLVREGAASAIISVPLAGRLAFQAADRLAQALADLYPRAVALGDVPDHVEAGAVSRLEQGVAEIEAVRVSNPVAPPVSALVRDGNVALFDRLAQFDPAAAGGLAADLVANARALADGLDPVVAQRAFAELAGARVSALAPSYIEASARAAAVNEIETDRLVRLAALTAWAEALLRRPYASRPDGVTARAEAAERFERELETATGAEYAPLFVAISDLRGRVVDYLSRLINDLAPVIGIEAARRMPSLYWAWRLYADPHRAGELVARNAVSHPSFMPLEFSALAR